MIRIRLLRVYLTTITLGSTVQLMFISIQGFVPTLGFKLHYLSYTLRNIVSCLLYGIVYFRFSRSHGGDY